MEELRIEINVNELNIYLAKKYKCQTLYLDKLYAGTPRKAPYINVGIGGVCKLFLNGTKYTRRERIARWFNARRYWRNAKRATRKTINS